MLSVSLSVLGGMLLLYLLYGHVVQIERISSVSPPHRVTVRNRFVKTWERGTPCLCYTSLTLRLDPPCIQSPSPPQEPSCQSLSSRSTKAYESKVAVRDLSLSIDAGRCLPAGPNGAGKTSSIRMMMGITLPDSGALIFSKSPSTAEASIASLSAEERGLYKK